MKTTFRCFLAALFPGLVIGFMFAKNLLFHLLASVVIVALLYVSAIAFTDMTKK